MRTQFEPGRYAVRIVDQRFVESAQKGTLGFCLTFRIVKRLDRPEVPVKPALRDITWWVTEKTVVRVLQDLRTLGYRGSTLQRRGP
jgi:hypothetical protein